MYKAKMTCRYDLEKDLIDRLHGTICRYQDQPVSVVVRGVNEIELHNTVDQGYIQTIKPNDPDFDISSIELGYVNTPANFNYKGVVYFLRKPFRRWRQGVSAHCIEGENIKGDNLAGMILYERYIRTQEFADMIRGNYPTYHEARESLKPLTTKEIAISKDVALEKTLSGITQVYFKTKNIGYLLPDDNTVHVPSSDMGWIVSKYLSNFPWVIK